MYALARTQHPKPPLDRIPITKKPMGFFSSRRTETGPVLASPNQSGGPIKSKWYAQSRSKREPKTSPLAKETAFTDIRPPNLTVSSERPSRPSGSSSRPPPSSYHTDQVTATLAQRLDELAVSNADGLLGDDEYRMLRQNLFERFGAGEQVPAELPTVRLSGPEKLSSSTQIHISPDGNFRVAQYASSARSSMSRTSSVTTAIKGAMRRVSGRASTSSNHSDHPDNASMISRHSQTSYRPPTSRKLTYQSSSASLASSSSNHLNHVPHDLRSLSSQQTGRSTRTSRTSASKGPPSSYHRRPMTFDVDDDRAKSSAEIRAEIQAVEAEGRRLMDNFNGLEVSALSKHNRPGPPPVTSRPNSTWTIMPEQHPHHTIPKQPPKPPRPPSNNNGPSIAQRKVSLGLSSGRRAVSPPTPAPPTFALPTPTRSSSPSPGRPSKTYLVRKSSSQSDLQRSAVLPVDGFDDPALDAIRQKKMDTMANYEEKLEYLRAKLKGAEIRERLAK